MIKKTKNTRKIKHKKKHIPKYRTITNKNNINTVTNKSHELHNIHNTYEASHDTYGAPHTTYAAPHESQDNLYYTSEVTDDATYAHFKSLIYNSPNLCKGQKQSGKKYKIRKSILRDMSALKKDNHYRIIYVHNNKEIIAYISTKRYKSDGGFLFIHKLCSKAGTGQGSRLFNIILEDGILNHERLGVTYLSLTTQDLDIVGYYKKFNPTRIVEVDIPESKAAVPGRCAYMIWQLSPNMPYLEYE